MVISNLTTALIAVDKKVKSMYSQLEVRWRWTDDAFNLYLEVDDLFNEIDTVLRQLGRAVERIGDRVCNVGNRTTSAINFWSYSTTDRTWEDIV